jgi:hypothetical protein
MRKIDKKRLNNCQKVIKKLSNSCHKLVKILKRVGGEGEEGDL